MTRLFSEKKIVIFDTEYTTWEGAQERKWSGSNEYREIVQIGAVKIDTNTLQELDSFLCFVKPIKNPKLSDFFITLTHITQNEVDEKGISFAYAVQKFFEWSEELNIYSFGADGIVMEENSALLQILFPFDAKRFYNIKNVFQAHGIPTENYMSSTITEAFGKKSPFVGHDALNDSRTIVEGLKLLKDKTI